MKFFTSLLVKILFCFIVNLILVVLLLKGFIALHVRVDMHRLLNRDASDRLRIAAALIIDDLDRSQNSQWPEILTKHKDIYQVDFALVLSDNSIIVSEGLKLPDQVFEQAASAINGNISDGSFPNYRHPKPWHVIERYHDGRLSYLHKKMDHGFARLMMRTKSPSRYWTGIRVSAPSSVGTDDVPAMLLVGSDSITGNGFFFNPFPWVVLVFVILIVSALLWLPFVRHITTPLARMTRAAEEIAKGKFDINLLEPRRDEIGRLSGAINHMTSRLRGMVEGQKRFLRDVAHELGAPISRIQMGMGILEQHMDEKNLGKLEDVAQDVAHLSDLVNELLSFSRAEATPEKISLKPLFLLPLIQRIVSREGMTAVDIHLDVDANIRAVADTALLSRAIANVVRNAVKYGGQFGRITISAVRKKSRVIIEVRDSGPGVSEELLDKIFEPFFRPEDSRSRESGGVGLGLSIVKTCMDTCGGSVSARNLTPRGLSVSLSLPSPD